MGPFPWKAEIFDRFENIEISDATGAYARAVIIYNEVRAPWAEKDAESIVKALNGTWGEGINPEAVPELVKAMENICADLLKHGPALCDTENPMHMAIYNSIHSAKIAVEKAKII